MRIRRLSRSVKLWLILLLLLSPLNAATFSANGTSLTVTSGNLQVIFSGPDVVGIANKLTGETYLRNPSSNMQSNITLVQPPSQGLAATGAWTMSSSSASLALSDTNRNLSITVSVDPATQEVVVTLNAAAAQGGVQWLIWGISGFDMSVGKFVIPAQGGISLTSASFMAQTSYSFFGDAWDAPLSLFQTNAGGVAVYSRDMQSLCKDLTVSSNQLQTANEQFYLEAQGPWHSATQAGPIEWRLAAYQGDWQAGARIYRDWHTSIAPPVPLTGGRAWVNNITTVIEEDGGDPYQTSDLDSLATVLVPSETLLYLVNWRSQQYDVGYPNYSWDSSTPAFVAYAHKLGFRVMLHTDVLGVAPTSADHASVQQYQIKDPYSLQLQGWNWNQPASTPQRYALIDPAASAYRSLFVSRVTPAIQTLQPDAIHLDFTAVFNDGNGPIEGRNYNQGLAQLQSDILAAFPNLVLGVEEVNDAIAASASFAQPLYWTTLHLNPSVTPAVPIAAYVLPNVRRYWHLGVTNPDGSGFIANLQQYEAQAVLPTLHTNVTNYSQADIARFLNVVDAFQSYNLLPAWDTAWNGAILKYQGTGGVTAALTDSGTVVQFATQNSTSSTVLYQRAHGVNELTSSYWLESWPAYNGSLTLGLNPAEQFWLDSTSPNTSLVHINGLPSGTRVGLGTGTLVTPNFAYFQLLPPAAPAFDFFSGLWQANVGVTYNGAGFPLQNGATANLTQMTVGGVTRQAVFTQPPFTAQRGGDVFLEYTVPMPAFGGASISYAAGILDAGIGQRQGAMTFKVTVNGTVLWQQDVSTGGWQAGSINLSAFLGQTIKIRFITDPGPSGNPNFGWGGWSALQLTVPSTDSISGISVATPPAFTSSNFSLSGGTVSVSNGTATVNGLPSGGTVLVFTGQPIAIAAGQSLLNIPFTISQSSNGQLAGPASSAYAGTGVNGPTTSGGIGKQSTLYAFAPANGQTIFSWLLRLPASPALTFSFSAGDWDGHTPFPFPQGYLMSVRINGTMLWQQNVNTTPGWAYGNVALSQWSGQTVLVELITDSQGPNTNDFTSWAELTFNASGSGSNCATSLSSYAPINAPQAGASGPIPITTAAGCDWSASSASGWTTATPSSSSGGGSVSHAIAPNLGPPRQSTLVIGGHEITVSQAGLTDIAPLGLHPVTPCRVMDTRNANGPLGGPFITGGSTRTIPVPSSACNIPANAAAYTLNVTVVPRAGTLSYLTVWPTGQSQPLVSTLNSGDGAVLANAAIVPAGTGGSINAYATNDTELIIDINGYFLPPATGTLQFYPLTPCRVLDTRNPNGTFGGPSISGRTSRSFPIPSSGCGVPGSAAAYSLNVTVVPQGPLGYLTAWPTGQSQPLASTLNSQYGTILANAAIVQAGTNGAVSFYADNTSDVVVDINGYFAPPGSGGLNFYTVTPCRIVDTRNANGTFGGPIMNGNTTRTFPLSQGSCGLPSAAAAYSLNMTVVPQGPLGYLTTWPAGGTQPLVSTLNAPGGQIVANAALVPAGTSGAIDVYVTSPTHVIIDTNGYFSGALTITTSALSSGTEGQSYSAPVAATGGTTPYTWSASGLPSGLTINSATGGISGIPVVGSAGTYMVTVTVKDSSSTQQSASTTFSLTIIQGPQNLLTVTGGTVGQNLQLPLIVTLSPGSSGSPVTIQSNNPAVVTLAARSTDAGTGSVSITPGAGTTTFQVFAFGVASSGSTVITASTTGYVSGTNTVTAAPSAFVLAGPNGIGGSFTAGQNSVTPLTVTAVSLDSSGNAGSPQALAGGQSAVVTLSVGTAALGTVSPASITFTGGQNNLTSQFTAGTTSVGSTITANEPTGFSTPAGGANVLSVTVSTQTLQCTAVRVGQNFENQTSCTLSGPAPSDTIVTLTSNDPTKLLLAVNATDVGSVSINRTIRAGTTGTPPFYVYGLGNTGQTSFGATAGGFTATGTVTLAKSGFVLISPFGLGANFPATAGGSPLGITVQTALLDASGNYLDTQAVAGAISASVTVTSSNTSVGTISGSPAVITGANNTANVQFQPLSGGTTVLTAVAPAGYTTPTLYATVTATVGQPKMLIDDGNTIGKNLERPGTIILLGATAPAGGLQVTLQATGSLLLSSSTNGDDAGNSTVVVTILAGQNSGTYYMYALDSAGTATVTATAAGFKSGSGTETLTPSGIVINGPGGQTGLIPFNTPLAAGDKPLSISTAQLDTSGNFVQVQPLAGSASLTIATTDSSPATGTVPSLATILPGNTAHGTATVQFHPLSVGSTSIGVAQPFGYTAPSDGTNSLKVNVQ